MQYRIHYKGQYIPITLDDKELSSGGQGRIYKVKSPSKYVGYCVKIYKDEHHSTQNKAKIEYMVNHRPENANMEKIRICWPECCVVDTSGHFAGYMMPLAFEDSRDLKIIEVYSFGKTIAEKFPQYPLWHGKYEIDTSRGLLNRIKMLYNVALALEIIHKSGKYVLVDFKPENVLATASGKISIVDTDSFQINDGKNQYFGPVATQEYFAKFAKIRSKNNLLQTADCDCFAMAIVFYKILMGSHPYSGYKLLPPYDTDDYSDIASRIDEELFVFGKKKEYIQLLKTNNMHDRFARLPLQLQTLFIQSFTSNEQPSAAMWRTALKNVIDSKTMSVVPTLDRPVMNATNMEARSLCVLVIDVSGSMNICIDTINCALSNFVDDLRLGRNGFRESSKDTVELAIIQFDSEVDIVRKPSLIRQNEHAPELRVRGLQTNTSQAIRTAMDIVKFRKSQYTAAGLPYYRPWIVLLTDGNPLPYNEQDINTLLYDVDQSIKKKHFILSAIGIGTKVSKSFLSKISNGNFGLISKSNISDFFQTLSTSVSSTTFGDPQEDLLGSLSDTNDYVV